MGTRPNDRGPTPTTLSKQNTPIYVPHVNACDTRKLRALYYDRFGRDATYHALNFAIDWLHDPSLHDPLADSRTPVYDSDLSHDELTALLRSDVVEASDPLYPASVYAFFRREEKPTGPRRRSILHTVHGNDHGTDPPNGMMRVTSYAALFAKADHATCCASRDMKSWYHQHLFAPAVRDFYTFRCEGKSFRLKRMPMGHKTSAACAHSVTCAITALATDGLDVKTDVIIDDVIFLSNSLDSLTTALARFDAICKSINATIGTYTAPSHAVDFRGVHFDLKAKTATIRRSTHDRYADRLATFAARPTVARARSLIGAAIWAMEIYAFSPDMLADIAFATHTVASEPMHVTPRLYASVTRLLTNILRVGSPEGPSPTLLAQPPPRTIGVLAADATPTQWGAVFIDNAGNVTSGSGPLDTHGAAIHVAEAQATLHAIDLIPARDTHARVIIATDNSVWFANATRRIPRALTEARCQLSRKLTKLNVSAVMIQVKSVDNPADAPSRGKAVSIGGARSFADSLTNEMREGVRCAKVR